MMDTLERIAVALERIADKMAPPRATALPKPPKPKPFRRPTHDELALYVAEIGADVEAQAFIDYYTANGWRVGGKSPMKDWKAAVRNWHRMGSNRHPVTNGPVEADW